MAEIVRTVLADRGFVRWSVACLLLVALSWWIQDQTNFVSLADGWPPLSALQVLTRMVLDAARILGYLGIGVWSWVAGATVFRSPSRIMSPREYVRNGLSALSFIIGVIVTFIVLGLMMAIVGSSGTASYVVELLGVEVAVFVAMARWRRQRSRGHLRSCGESVNKGERNDSQN